MTPRHKLTSSSRANWSAAPSSARTARAKSRQRPRSRLGASVLTSCASSIAASLSRRRLRLPCLLRGKLPNHPRKFITNFCDTSGPPTWSEGPFVRLRFSPPPLPHRSAQGIQREAERAFGHWALERQQDGSATTPARKLHRRVPPFLRQSAGFPAAFATSCSCLQEGPQRSSLWACRTSTSHMPCGAGTGRRSHKCSSRARGRKISTLLGHPLRLEPSAD